LEYVQLNLSGNQVDCYLQGATITSYKTSGKELLFVSEKANFSPGKAIRGGIPICFPQFGPGELPQHGFARTSLWSVRENKVTDDSVQVVFTLADNEQTRKVWNHSFSLEYFITLYVDKLKLELRVVNNNEEKAFEFTVALHTYFRVSNIRNVGVHGLSGLKYVDKVKSVTTDESNSVVEIDQEVDRVYLNAPSSVTIQDSTLRVIIEKGGFNDLVVWNPWIAKAKAMADFGDEEYLGMICCEVGQISVPVALPSKSAWVGKQIIRAAL